MFSGQPVPTPNAHIFTLRLVVIHEARDRTVFRSTKALLRQILRTLSFVLHKKVYTDGVRNLLWATYT